MAKSYLCQIFAKMSTPEEFNRNSQAEYFVHSLSRLNLGRVVGSWKNWKINCFLDPKEINANFEDSA